MEAFKEYQTSLERGLFLTFEGGEGTGKSTQIRKVSAWLEAQHIPVALTREPGGTKGAEEIRELLVQGRTDRWDALTEALLLFAARRDHVEHFIIPSLQKKMWVLCDRFTDSSWVYQGFASKLGVEKIEALTQIVLEDFKPDLTFILDLPPEIGLERAYMRLVQDKQHEDRFEKKGLSFHQSLHEGYHLLAEKNQDRCFLISALGSEEDVFTRIVDVLKNVCFRDKILNLKK